MINPKIVRIIEQKGFETSNIITYLLSLHYNLKPDYIPELVKKQTYVTGIVNRDFKHGTILWIVPLFDSVSTNPPPAVQWEWVDKEYRKLFIEIRKDAGGDKQACMNKMKKFFSENPEVRKDDVIRATMLYLDGFKSGKEDPKFLQQANYFIFKGVQGAVNYQSRLSQFLELVGEGQNPKSNRRMKGLQ